MACINPTHDHFTPIEVLDDQGIEWDAALVTVNEHGEKVVPCTCTDCGCPMHYDLASDQWRADDPTDVCFLHPRERDANDNPCVSG